MKNLSKLYEARVWDEFVCPRRFCSIELCSIACGYMCAYVYVYIHIFTQHTLFISPRASTLSQKIYVLLALSSGRMICALAYREGFININRFVVLVVAAISRRIEKAPPEGL